MLQTSKWRKVEGELTVDDNLPPENTVPPQRSTAKIRPRFFGSYTHSVDAKGRMIIPNAYRYALGETFSIGPTLDFKAIALYPDATFDQILDDFSMMNQRKPDVQKVVTTFYKLSYRDIQADAQGRLLLPTNLREAMLGEAKDLEVSGCANHVRVMDAALSKIADDDFMQHRDEILERFGNLQPDD